MDAAFCALPPLAWMAVGVGRGAVGLGTLVAVGFKGVGEGRGSDVDVAALGRATSAPAGVAATDGAAVVAPGSAVGASASGWAVGAAGATGVGADASVSLLLPDNLGNSTVTSSARATKPAAAPPSRGNNSPLDADARLEVSIGGCARG